MKGRRQKAERRSAQPRALCLILFSAFCLLPSAFQTPSAFATPVSSAIKGRVTSEGRAADHVLVTATSSALMHARTTMTGPRGTYWLGALPPGDYEITFSRKGLTTLTRRAVVELARVARVDASLDPSEDEESVTSTATTINVSDTTEITTHFPSALLERLPIHRDPYSAALVGPGAFTLSSVTNIDSSLMSNNEQFGEEIIEAVTVIRGGLPVEYARFHGSIVTAITKSGGEEFHVSLRDTMSSGDHVFESASGGRIVPERLWFFAAGWTGEVDGYAIKLSAQPGARDLFAGEILDTNESTLSAFRYTGFFGHRLAIESVADRMEDVDTVSAKATYVMPSSSGDHILSAGGSLFEGASSFFFSDRFSISRFTVNAGVRRDDGGFDPRVAITYDVLGTGRRAIVATYGEYNDPALRITSIGYAGAIGSSGGARIDAFRRQSPGSVIYDVQLDGRYRLFDQFEFGANYTYVDDLDDTANAWVSAEFPFGDHRFGATVLERQFAESWFTDFAVRYAIPFPRFTLTLASDVMNAFDDPREVRFWARARY